MCVRNSIILISLKKKHLTVTQWRNKGGERFRDFEGLRIGSGKKAKSVERGEREMRGERGIRFFFGG